VEVPRDEMEMDWLALLIVMVKVDVVAVAELESVTRIEIVEEITVVGVPEIVPVDALSASPAGSEPDESAKVFPPAPPDADNERA